MRLIVLLVLVWPLAASADCPEDALTFETDWGDVYCFYGSPFLVSSEEEVVYVQYAPDAADRRFPFSGFLLLGYNASGDLTRIGALAAKRNSMAAGRLPRGRALARRQSPAGVVIEKTA